MAGVMASPLKFKVVLIGNCGSGKSCLLHRMRTGEFSVVGSTNKSDYHTIQVDVRERPVQLYVWDTAGQERFRGITRQYLRDSSAAIVVYSIADEESFLSVPEWIEEVRKTCCNKPVQLFLVGAKADLNEQRQVEEERGRRYATNDQVSAFYETSALRGLNVEAVFEAVGAGLVDHQRIWEEADTSIRLEHQQVRQREQQRLQQAEQQQRKCC